MQDHFDLSVRGLGQLFSTPDCFNNASLSSTIPAICKNSSACMGSRSTARRHPYFDLETGECALRPIAKLRLMSASPHDRLLPLRRLMTDVWPGNARYRRPRLATGVLTPVSQNLVGFGHRVGWNT